MNTTFLQDNIQTTKTPYLSVRTSAIQGTGVICDKAFKKGEVMYVLEGTLETFTSNTVRESLSIPTWYGLGNGAWLNPGTTLGSYVNHSCAPTAAIVGTRTIVAKRDVMEGEELTVDYSMTDEDPLWYMLCRCGHRACRKVIRSIQSIPEDVFFEHFPLIPMYFQEVYKRSHPNLATLQVCNEYAHERYL
jgi:uncharacterized protein